MNGSLQAQAPSVPTEQADWLVLVLAEAFEDHQRGAAAPGDTLVDFMAKRVRAKLGAATEQDWSAVLWAVERWKAEVENRPLVNKNRRPLDDAWRQVIRHFGGDPDTLLPLADHDTLISEAA